MFKWITAGAVAGMVAVGTFFTVDMPVSAQADDGGPAQEQVEQRRGNHRGHQGSSRSQDRSEHQASVAEILGLTVEELQAARDAGQRLDQIVETQGLTMEEFQAAMQAAKIAQINQAVADGELTQEQADAMIERIENGDGPGRGGRGNGPKHRGPQAGGERGERGERGAVVAEVLGMTAEELQAAREAGQKLNEIVEAQGLTMEEFQAAMQAAKIAQINQAVVDGELTQEQADAMIERIENGNDGPGRGERGRGGPGGGGQRR